MLIDADSIPYIVGWNYKDDLNHFAVESAVDEIVNGILRSHNAGAYLGVIGPESSAGNFRRKVYKVATYKGNRPESPEWLTLWKPVVEKRLIEHHKFVRAPEHLETDDVIVAVATKFQTQGFESKGLTLDPVICSPDKDLKQAPGIHYDYKTGITLVVDAYAAARRMYIQMIMGDFTDNIKGIPKFGIKKAELLLATGDEFMWEISVRAAYDDYYGSYYGPIIFAENQAVVMMMEFSHPGWDRFGFRVADYVNKIVVL